jgi:hypothetical protein
MSIDTFLLSADTTDLNYPEVRPTLDLNFARVKALDPRITFTRSSGGSYVGADGLIKYAGVNEPRFDHDPSTGESLGLLIEESRSNLTTYSEQLDNARWAVSNFTLSTNTSNTNAPDGTNTAEQILETGTATAHAFYSFNAYSISAGTVYTASIFVKSINKQFVQLIFDDNATTNGGYVNFDLTSGTITASANYGTGASISGTIIAYSNSWYRISITSTAGTSATLARFSTNGITSGGSGVFPGYAGNTSNGYYLWGAQLEAGAFATSYIPTEASTRTRAADNASITGKNFSEWYRQDEGTFYADTKINGVQTTRFDKLWAITNANLNFEGISIFISGVSSSSYVFSIEVTNIPIAQVAQGVIETAFTTPRLKSVFALKQNNCAGAVNGQQRFVDSTVDLSLFTTPVDRLLIGQPQRFQGHSCMTISRLTYYPKRLPNAQLQALTR